MRKKKKASLPPPEPVLPHAPEPMPVLAAADLHEEPEEPVLPMSEPTTFTSPLTPPLIIDGEIKDPPQETTQTPPPTLPRTSLRWNDLLRAFSPSERLLLYIFSIALSVSSFILLANVNLLVSSEVPTQGGTITEGSTGTVRFINPLLMMSDPDQDLGALVYSGLLRASENGDYIPDLAERYDINENGTVYTFHLRKDLTFHDGEPLRAEDVIFTIELAQNPQIKSTKRVDWDGVQVSAPDEYTIVFTLPHAYAPFRENATIGILPKHLWESVTPEEFPFSALNTHPVGSGPYRIRDVTADSTGTPREYRLAAFSNFALGKPHIQSIIYRTYESEDEILLAYNSGDIDSFVATSPKLLPHELQNSELVRRAALSRVFGVFLNQNHAAALASLPVRQALDVAIDKDAIIRSVLGGYGTALNAPVPPGLLPNTATTTPPAPADRIAAARDILTRAGWKFDEIENVWKKDSNVLAITLATADTEELAATAQAVAEAWKAVGIQTNVQIYPLQEFNSNILRPRSYDAILFGEIVGRSLDLYAFWHSSQRNDPGLNLSLYTNADADSALSRARTENTLATRQEALRSFLTTLDEDRPAVFLYSPQLAYIVPSRLKGVAVGTLSAPADRFASIHTWYRDTERVWNVFQNGFHF